MNTGTKALLGIGVGVILIWLLYAIFSGPTHIGDLDIKNGQAQFQHEDFSLSLMNVKKDGQLKILKAKSSGNSDYKEYSNYKVEGDVDQLMGQWSIEIPIPADLLAKYKHPEELKQHLFIAIETPSLSSMGNGALIGKKRIVETIIDLDAGVAIAMLPLNGELKAVGEDFIPRMNRKKTGFSLFPKAYGYDWSERFETAKYRFTYVAYCLRHYTAFSVDKRESSGGYFKAYAPIELSRLAMDSTLAYLEDAMFIIENKLGMSFEGLKKPIQVEIFNKPKGTAGEFYAPYFIQGGGVLELNAKFFTKRPTLMTANERNELRVTCGHELLHLVQEYYRDVGGISKEKIHWLDEATAVYAESLFSRQKGAPDLTSTFKEKLGTEPLYYTHKKLDFKGRQNFGYGASYLIFYLANNSAYKSRAVGAIYNNIKKKSNNPAAAINSVFFMDSYWPKFWETVFTKPEKIYPNLKFSVTSTVQLEQQHTSTTDLKIKLPSELKTAVKNKSNTGLSLQISLENLTALPVDFLMNPNRAKNRDFINKPEAKVHLSLEGDTEGIQLLVLYRKGGSWISKGFGKSGNTLNLVTQEEKKNFRLVFINNNDNLAELSSRQLKVHLNWSMGDQPKSNPNFEAQLQTLEQWKAFCAKQKQAQQQSNNYLRNYYKEKEQEYKLAINILKEEGEFIYEVTGDAVRPEDPVQLAQDLSAALHLILDASVKSKKNREKMEQMANQSSGADRKGYRQVAKFFKHRNQGYQHLMSYITAVRKAKELADNNGGNSSNSGNNYSNNNNGKASHQGTWRVKGDLSGTITVGAKTLNINLKGRARCELLINTTETIEKQQLNIQLNNVPYRLDGSFVYVDKGDLVFSSAYNYYNVEDKCAIRMQLSTASGQLDFSYIDSTPSITRRECEGIYLTAKK
jgi:hypothetical protein